MQNKIKFTLVGSILDLCSNTFTKK